MGVGVLDLSDNRVGAAPLVLIYGVPFISIYVYTYAFLFIPFIYLSSLGDHAFMGVGVLGLSRDNRVGVKTGGF